MTVMVGEGDYLFIFLFHAITPMVALRHPELGLHVALNCLPVLSPHCTEPPEWDVLGASAACCLAAVVVELGASAACCLAAVVVELQG